MNKTPIISIIDDDQSCRMALGSLVRSLGHEARLFASAQDFLDSPALNDTDCLISDVQMPGISGLKLQQTLLDQGKNLPIIFITAYPKESVRQQALQRGAAHFLGKPYNARLIIDCIEQVLLDKSV